MVDPSDGMSVGGPGSVEGESIRPQNIHTNSRPPDIVVHETNETFFADVADGITLESGTSIGPVLQSAIDYLDPNGGSIAVHPTNPTFRNGLTIPGRISLYHPRQTTSNATGDGGNGFATWVWNGSGHFLTLKDTDNPCESVQLANIELVPLEAGDGDDAVHCAAADSVNGEVRDVTLSNVSIRHFGGKAVGDGGIGPVYNLILDNVKHLRCRSGGIVLSGVSKLNTKDFHSYAASGTWSVNANTVYARGGVIGGLGNGIKFQSGIVSVDGEIGDNGTTGTVGVQPTGTNTAYIVGGRWHNWGTCIQLGSQGTNCRAVVNTHTSAANDGPEVVKRADGGKTEIVLQSIGPGSYTDNSGQPLQTQRQDFGHDRPYRQERVEYIYDNLPVGRNGAVVQTSRAGVVLVDDGDAWMPIGGQHGHVNRYTADFAGAVPPEWSSNGTGTVSVPADYLHVETGSTSGDHFRTDHGGTTSLPVGGSDYKTSQGGFETRFRINQTSSTAAEIGLFANSNTYIAVVASSSNANFRIHVVDGGVQKSNIDTGVGLDTSWHSLGAMFFGEGSDMVFDGSQVASDGDSIKARTEPYIDVTTSASATRSMDVQFVDHWAVR